MEGIKGKNVLLVGATGGIGSKTAKLLASSGANLFLAGRNAGKLAEVAAEVNVPSTHYFALDLADVAQVQQLKDKYFAALKYAERTDNKNLFADMKNNIGMLYYSQKQYREAIPYYLMI
jgi:NAD(P)-dependent dehydrogenase (short-subunit alcohol dehydrogenase family)